MFHLKLRFIVETCGVRTKAPRTKALGDKSPWFLDHFGETATGSMKLGQHFYQHYFAKTHYPRNPVVPSESKCIVSVLFDQLLKQKIEALDPVP